MIKINFEEKEWCLGNKVSGSVNECSSNADQNFIVLWESEAIKATILDEGILVDPKFVNDVVSFVNRLSAPCRRE